MVLSIKQMKFVCGVVFSACLFLVNPIYAETSEQDFYEKALIYYQDGEFSQSLNSIKTALKIKPEHLPSRILYGEILLQFGEFAAAETQFKRALSFNADTSLVLPKLAQTLAIQNKYDELVETILPDSTNDDVNFAILMYRGQSLENLRRYDEALVEFESAFRLKPKSATVALAKAGVAKKQNRPEAFHAQLQRAQELAPDSPIVKFFKAEMMRRAGDKRAALDAYSEIIAEIPDFFDVRRSRAAVLIELNELESALEDINLLLEESPTDPFTRLLQAVALSKTEQGDRANSILDDIVGDLSVIDKETYEDFAPIHFINGAAQFLLKKYVAAEKHLLKALEANPQGKNIRELLAEIAYQRGEKRKIIDILQPIPVSEMSIRSAELFSSTWLAIEDYDQALAVLEALDSDIAVLPQFVKLRSAVLFKIGQTDKAVAALEASTLATSDEKVGLMLGYHALAIGDIELAQQVADKLQLVDDKTLVSYNYIGAVKLANDEIDDAAKYFLQALAISPTDVISRLNLTRTYIANGQLDRAKNDIYTLAKFNPDNVDVIRAKMAIDRRTNNLPAYRESLAKLVALNPSAKELVIEYVNILLAQNKPDVAMPFVDRLRDEYTFWPPVLVAQAKVHVALGNYANAQRALRVLFGLVEDGGQLVKLGEMFIEAKSLEFVDKTIQRLEKMNYTGSNLVRLQSQYEYLTGKQDAAIRRLELDVKANGRYQSTVLLAKLLAQSKQIELATHYAKLAYEQRSDGSSVQLLANLYWQTDQADAAVKLMYSYLDQMPSDRVVRAALANMLHQMGKPKQAVVQYKKLLDAEPNNLFGLINLAVLAIDEQDFDTADQYAAEALKTKADDAVVLDLNGWIKVNQGDLNAGLKMLRDSFSRNASNPTNLYHLSYTLVALNRTAEAKQLLEKALLNNQAFTERESAKQLLDRIQ